ncbi:MAG: DUF814 domain-containing protein [Cyclobacteriaceae bacterium]
MFHSFYFIKRLSGKLEEEVLHACLMSCFTQNKDELILGFLKPDNQEFFIRATLQPNISLLSFPADYARARKNSTDLFVSLHNHRVIGIDQTMFDRSFTMRFDNNQQLLFKLHGNRSNLLLVENQKVTETFRSVLIHDLSLIPAQLPKSIDLNQPSSEAIILLESTFTPEIKDYLKSESNYYDQEPTQKAEIFGDLLYLMDHSSIKITYSDRPRLTLLPTNAFISETNDPIEACNELYRIFTQQFFLDQEKGKLIKPIKRDIKQSQNYISKNQLKLDEIQKRRSYSEIADIVMANLHQIPKGSGEIDLHDFYKNESIKIKLKPNLSPQKFAEQLYQKSKNQSKEIQNLKANIIKKETHLNSLQERLTSIDNLTSLKALKPIKKASSSVTKPTVLPYHSLDFQGFEIRIGKNAKNNDLLTFKFTSKNDTWLHARDVAGSHVVIANPNQKVIPKKVLEKAAELAGFYSKRNQDTLCPVSYTLKKYIRKPKGLPPGKVIMDREEVIMVEPKRQDNLPH